MSNEPTREGMVYKVVCTWCGVTIRRCQTKNSHGMCLNCYSRVLSEHLRAQQALKPRYASDR